MRDGGEIVRFDSVRLESLTKNKSTRCASVFEAARRTQRTCWCNAADRIFHCTNDAWIRDYGPIFVNRLASAAASIAQVRSRLIGASTRGRKVRAFDLDDVVRKSSARYGLR